MTKSPISQEGYPFHDTNYGHYDSTGSVLITGIVVSPVTSLFTYLFLYVSLQSIISKILESTFFLGEKDPSKTFSLLLSPLRSSRLPSRGSSVCPFFLLYRMKSFGFLRV